MLLLEQPNFKWAKLRTAYLCKCTVLHLTTAFIYMSEWWKRSRCNWIQMEVLLIWTESPCVVLESHLSGTPATERNRLSFPLRMRHSLKGYTVMALTSWSYRGKSGRECSAAGLTLTFEQVCGVYRGGPSGPRFSVDFHRSCGRTSRSSLWVFCLCRALPVKCLESVTIATSNCCTEIIKSPYPRLPFDRIEGKPVSGRALPHPPLPLLTCCTLPHGF